MIVKKNTIYDMVVEDIAYGGKGIAKIKNFVIFIDNVVPGDILKAKIIKKFKNYAFAVVVNFIQYSKYRIKPKCVYSEYCGGCKWQNLDYNQQLIYKNKYVEETIKHIALFENIQVNTIIPSDTIFGYRNKMEFSCSNIEWIPPKNIFLKRKKKNTLGLHVSGNFSKILNISSCLLQPNIGNKILRSIKYFMESSNLSFYNSKTRLGYWKSIVIRNSVFSKKWIININTSVKNRKEIKILSNFLKEEHSDIVSIINTVTPNFLKNKKDYSKKMIKLFGQDILYEKIGNYFFEMSNESFFQTNINVTKKLYNVIKCYASLTGRETVLDLYCGTGSIGLYLSAMAKKIIGIEVIKKSLNNAKKNCILNNVSNCEFILGDVKNKLSSIFYRPDLIIVDPPRFGINPKVLKSLLEIKSNKLIYVSCNPGTFSRDLLELKKAYEVEEIQPIDMFPHTFHVELVAKLIKKRRFISVLNKIH